MHASMQYSDTKAQQIHDAQAVFAYAQKHRVWWLTGTEANQPADAANFRIGAEQYSYQFIHRGGDVWVALSPLVAAGRPSSAWTAVIPGKKGAYPTRGVLRVSFSHVQLGRITVLASHYNLSGPKHPNAPGAKQNPIIAAELQAQVRKYGKGNGLVFYGGDQNMHDERPHSDTFFGGWLISAWDELDVYDPTHPGHETIDVIARSIKDTRVGAVYCHGLDDTKIALHTDHYPVEASYDIRPLR